MFTVFVSLAIAGSVLITILILHGGNLGASAIVYYTFYLLLYVIHTWTYRHNRDYSKSRKDLLSFLILMHLAIIFASLMLTYSFRNHLLQLGMFLVCNYLTLKYSETAMVRTP
jgi:hypothetical protein